MKDDPLHISPYLLSPPRGLDETCRDEGYRARLRGDARKTCTYTFADMRDAWRDGWDAVDAALKAKENDDAR